MRLLLVGGLLALAGCGGGGTTGTNYSDTPPMAEIVATPTPKPSASATPEQVEAVDEAAVANDTAVENATEAEAPANATE